VSAVTSRREQAGVCARGHAMTPENRHRVGNGYDRCRQCDRERQRARRQGTMQREARSGRVTVRCDACAGVFTDDLRALSPCPYCGQVARGAA
jgi:hypothetical protein